MIYHSSNQYFLKYYFGITNAQSHNLTFTWCALNRSKTLGMLSVKPHLLIGLSLVQFSSIVDSIKFCKNKKISFFTYYNIFNCLRMHQKWYQKKFLWGVCPQTSLFCMDKSTLVVVFASQHPPLSTTTHLILGRTWWSYAFVYL